jgi:3-hydroxyisobutyrate dehydrogenase
MEEEVGVVGLGALGYRMALALLRSQHHVVGYDLRSDTRVQIERAGGAMAVDLDDLARRTRFVSVVVLSEKAVAEVCARLCSAMPEGSFVLVHSTIRPELARSLSEQARQQGVTLVDATVCGDLGAAEEGRLAMMLGAKEEEMSPAAKVISALSSNTHYLGERGRACAVTLAGNVISIINQLAFFEGQRLASSFGVNTEKLIDICSTNSGGSWALTNHAKGDWKLRHHTVAGLPEIYAMARKDLDMACAAAQSNGVTTSFVAAVSEMIPDQLAQRMRELNIPVVPFDGNSSMPEPMTKEQEILEIGIEVRDMPAMLDFYSRVLGMDVVGEDHSMGRRRYALAFGRAILKLLWTDGGWEQRNPRASPTERSYGFIHLTLKTADAEELTRRCEGVVEVVVPWTTLDAAGHGPQGYSYVRDPEGNLVHLAYSNNWQSPVLEEPGSGHRPA